jgi:ABC-type phosphate transport system substrate-binding protein
MSGKIAMFAMVISLAVPAISWAEGIAVIVHAKNVMDSMTEADVSRIYQGRMTAWPDGTPVVAVNRDARSDIRKDFYEKVLQSKPTEKFFLPGSPVPFRTLVQKSGEAMIRFVASEPRAIGYVYLSELTGQARGVRVLLTID